MIVKVHVMLYFPFVVAYATIRKNLELLGLKNINDRGVQKYGLVTGECEQNDVEKLRFVDGVESVTANTQKHLI